MLVAFRIIPRTLPDPALGSPDLTGNLTRGYERKKEKPRDRRLSEDEIRALGVAYLSEEWDRKQELREFGE